MFLYIDESEAETRKVIGGILLPNYRVGELEKNLANERISSKLFGEIKWTSISGNAYTQAYINILDLFWSDPEATYHSCSYDSINNRYKAAYMLIRAVSWKIENNCALQRQPVPPLYVLFDDGGTFGTSAFPQIKRMLGRDSRFHMNLEFCNHGHSHVNAGLQISDLLTGAVSARINSTRLSTSKGRVLAEIESKNNGAIGVNIVRFPQLYDFKMHHFDLTRLQPTP